MYSVYCDNLLIYDSNLENMKLFQMKAELELNKTGSFSFTIYPDHYAYAAISKLKSIITVYQDDFLLFKGRVLDEEIGFHNEKQVTCEGELAFLLDSIQRPYDYTGSISGFLSMLIDSHNSQVEAEHQFTLGNVTVTDSNNTIVRASTDYKKTLDVINESLINLLGGYISIRRVGNTRYIDYLADFALLSPQKIEFARNLLDMKRTRKGEDIATALIPLGATIENSNERLTITSVNEGLDYIYDVDAVNQYGWIFATNAWDDVTIASNLLTKGRAYLAGLVSSDESIELSAADLAAIDETIESFHLGTYVNVISNPHGINQNFLVSKLSINLLDPASNKLTLGGINDSFTSQASKNTKAQDDIIHVIRENVSDVSTKIYQTEQNLMTSIESSAENIQLSVAENYYLKDETDSLVSSVSTELELTKDALNLEFTQFQTDIEALANGTDAEFEEIKKYIRFVDGKILLGEVGNELELQIANNKIAFIQDGAEVAYFTNRKMYVTDGEYTNSLRLGNFAFLPRANGNLSFKKL